MLHQPHTNLGPSGSIKSYCASKVPITPRKSAPAWSVGDDQPDFESVQSFSGSLTRRSGRLSAAAASRAFTAFFPKVSLAPLPDIHTGEPWHMVESTGTIWRNISTSAVLRKPTQGFITGTYMTF